MVAVTLKRLFPRTEFDHALMFCGDDPIALAGRLLETGAIDDFQRAPRFPHGAAALQLVQGRRYHGSSHAKHHGQEILGERNGVVVEPVMDQKQQSRQTFHERVAGVAQDRLRLLDEQCVHIIHQLLAQSRASPSIARRDRKSTRLNSSHTVISYAVFCLKKKKTKNYIITKNNKNKTKMT